MKIVFSGGGTLGPVAPLLAIAETYKKIHPEVEFVWVGTKNGPEKELVSKYQIPFFVISSGKWRRYFSLRNVVDLIKLKIAFWQSLFFLLKHKPDLLISVGGFVSVPLHWVGWILRIPTWVHQQDVKPGLANRLMAWRASKVTVALQESIKYYSQAEWIGNPVRDLAVTNYLDSKSRFNIPEKATTIFALGGGTGSARINQLIVESLGNWPADWHVIHLLGRGRPQEAVVNAAKLFPNYHAYEFFTDEMKDAYAAADIVICRAGFATLTELASLKKSAIVIPMPDTHQEANAKYLAEEKAVVYFNQRTATGVQLSKTVSDLLADGVGRELMASRFHEILPAASTEKIVEIIDALKKI